MLYDSVERRKPMQPQRNLDEEAAEERLRALRDSEIGRVFEPILQPIAEAAANAFGDLTVAAVDPVKTAARQVGEFQSSALDRMTGIAREATSRAADYADRLTNGVNIVDAISNAGTAAQQAASSATGAIRRTGDYFDSVPIPQFPGAGFDANLLSAANPMKAFEAGLQFAGPALETAWDVVEPVIDVAGGVLEALGDIASGIDLNL